jgi:hypothetical protein
MKNWILIITGLQNESKTENQLTCIPANNNNIFGKILKSTERSE